MKEFSIINLYKHYGLPSVKMNLHQAYLLCERYKSVFPEFEFYS